MRENERLRDEILSLRVSRVRLEERVDVLEQSSSPTGNADLIRLVDRKDERIKELEDEISRLKADMTRVRIPSSPIPPPIVTKPMLTQRVPPMVQRREPTQGTSEARKRSHSKNRLAQSISGPLSELKPVLSSTRRESRRANVIKS